MIGQLARRSNYSGLPRALANERTGIPEQIADTDSILLDFVRTCVVDVEITSAFVGSAVSDNEL